MIYLAKQAKRDVEKSFALRWEPFPKPKTQNGISSVRKYADVFLLGYRLSWNIPLKIDVVLLKGITWRKSYFLKEQYVLSSILPLKS